MKYELIKKYPDSPKLGAVAVKEKDFLSIPHYRVLETTIILREEEVESFPEFWEKIDDCLVPEGTIIQSKINKINGTVRFLQGDEVAIDWVDGSFCKFRIRSLNNYLRNNNYDIAEIKNKEGVVYRVGGKVKGKFSGKVTIINKIYIENNTIYIYLNSDIYRTTLKTFSNYFTPYKREKLFTTDDKVNIYEGDTYYTIAIDDGVLGLNIADSDSGKNGDYFYYLSDKNTALKISEVIKSTTDIMSRGSCNLELLILFYEKK